LPYYVNVIDLGCVAVVIRLGGRKTRDQREASKRNGGNRMKLIKAYIRTNMIDKVIHALEAGDFTDMTLIDVKAIALIPRIWISL